MASQDRKRIALLVLLLWTTAGLPAFAQQTPPQIDRERIRIGLPSGLSGQNSGRSRNGAWAPISVNLKAGAQGNPQNVYRLRIETTDLEELSYQYTVPVPALAADSERTVTGYIVPGGDGANFKVVLETNSGEQVQAVPRLTRDANRDEVLGQADVLFFALGAGLSQLKRAAEKLDKLEKAPVNEAEIDPEAGRRQFVFADDVALLPDRWFGYDAVDIVVLATGNPRFVNQFAEESEAARRNALLEWVRRGGQLVMSVGRSKQEVAKLLEKMPLLDCKITGSELKKELLVVSREWCKREIHRPPLQQIETAVFAPGKGVHVMVRDAGRSVILESSCGLGRVILVGFDVDMPPFSTWDGQQAFWTRVQNEIAPPLPGRKDLAGARQGGQAMRKGAAPAAMGMDWGDRYDLRDRLKHGLEFFEEIPVISIAWVLLFILFYIALVGPLDYFILKKLFNRLELTWVTFPLTVVVVSVAAYFVAYSLKGDDVRINKVDIVEIDLHQPSQVYGQTFFTLFSPRVQSYTIGMEPAGGARTAPVPAGAPGPVVTLLEGGDRTSRTGSEALFPRPYRYAEEAAGLREVPVPVWATRSFTASWRAPVPPTAPPIGINDEIGPIRQARDAHDSQILVGRLTNNLGVELRSAALFYRDKWYDLGTLSPGESKRVELLFARGAQGQNRIINEWFTDKRILMPHTPIAPSGRPLSGAYREARQTYEQIKPMLFYRAYRGGDDKEMTNAGLRTLDQSWRLGVLPEFPRPERSRYRSEAILVARAPMLSDRAETVTQHPASPTRLWIGALPDAGVDRPELAGFINQETFLRVYIPVESR